jgi:hypothetical protein
MIYMTDRPNVAMRLVPVKLLLRHLSFLLVALTLTDPEIAELT